MTFVAQGELLQIMNVIRPLLGNGFGRATSLTGPHETAGRVFGLSIYGDFLWHLLAPVQARAKTFPKVPRDSCMGAPVTRSTFGQGGWEPELKNSISSGTEKVLLERNKERNNENKYYLN